MPKKKLIQEVEARWNGTFQMLERVAELREPVGAALAGLKTDITALTSEDFSIVCECLAVLSPFFEATIELSEEKKVSGSKVVPLLKMIEKTIQEETAKVAVPVAQELGEHLIRLLREKLYKVQSMSILSLATLLDPRFKALGFFCPMKKEEAIKRLTAECSHIIGSTSRSLPPVASTSQDSGAERPGQYFWFDLHTTLEL
ncbi:zinc finger BED domain-containing protein 4-like isoform X2 [Solea senegalensis]|uniref:Zinc finger BED domain-containing protein 4-like isoform X2 n=1 Tax=Solea senegalensis TaxID=28829 RepID=A0AAV6T6T0_SOLSE|nr:zinc finger BED domain-containing protein 4-like isoform X2 [Solea senegalensis]